MEASKSDLLATAAPLQKSKAGADSPCQQPEDTQMSITNLRESSTDPGYFESAQGTHKDNRNEDHDEFRSDIDKAAGTPVARYNPSRDQFKCVRCGVTGGATRIAEHFVTEHAAAAAAAGASGEATAATANADVCGGGGGNESQSDNGALGFRCPLCTYTSDWPRCVRVHLNKQHGLADIPASLWASTHPLLADTIRSLEALKCSVLDLIKSQNDPNKSSATSTTSNANTGKDSADATMAAISNAVIVADPSVEISACAARQASTSTVGVQPIGNSQQHQPDQNPECPKASGSCKIDAAAQCLTSTPMQSALDARAEKRVGRVDHEVGENADKVFSELESQQEQDGDGQRLQQQEEQHKQQQDAQRRQDLQEQQMQQAQQAAQLICTAMSGSTAPSGAQRSLADLVGLGGGLGNLATSLSQLADLGCLSEALNGAAAAAAAAVGVAGLAAIGARSPEAGRSSKDTSSASGDAAPPAQMTAKATPAPMATDSATVAVPGTALLHHQTPLPAGPSTALPSGEVAIAPAFTLEQPRLLKSGGAGTAVALRLSTSPSLCREVTVERTAESSQAVVASTTTLADIARIAACSKLLSLSNTTATTAVADAMSGPHSLQPPKQSSQAIAPTVSANVGPTPALTGPSPAIATVDLPTMAVLAAAAAAAAAARSSSAEVTPATCSTHTASAGALSTSSSKTSATVAATVPTIVAPLYYSRLISSATAGSTSPSASKHKSRISALAKSVNSAPLILAASKNNVSAASSRPGTKSPYSTLAAASAPANCAVTATTLVRKRYTCEQCAYSTDRRDLYNRHENIHKEDKPFHCYVCHKLFNRADHVKKHFLRIHKGRPYDVALIRRRNSASTSTTTKSVGSVPTPAASVVSTTAKPVSSKTIVSTRVQAVATPVAMGLSSAILVKPSGSGTDVLHQQHQQICQPHQSQLNSEIPKNLGTTSGEHLLAADSLRSKRQQQHDSLVVSKVLTTTTGDILSSRSLSTPTVCVATPLAETGAGVQRVYQLLQLQRQQPEKQEQKSSDEILRNVTSLSSVTDNAVIVTTIAARASTTQNAVDGKAVDSCTKSRGLLSVASGERCSVVSAVAPPRSSTIQLSPSALALVRQRHEEQMATLTWRAAVASGPKFDATASVDVLNAGTSSTITTTLGATTPTISTAAKAVAITIETARSIASPLNAAGAAAATVVEIPKDSASPAIKTSGSVHSVVVSSSDDSYGAGRQPTHRASAPLMKPTMPRRGERVAIRLNGGEGLLTGSKRDCLSTTLSSHLASTNVASRQCHSAAVSTDTGSVTATTLTLASPHTAAGAALPATVTLVTSPSSSAQPSLVPTTTNATAEASPTAAVLPVRPYHILAYSDPKAAPLPAVAAAASSGAFRPGIVSSRGGELMATIATPCGSAKSPTRFVLVDVRHHHQNHQQGQLQQQVQSHHRQRNHDRHEDVELRTTPAESVAGTAITAAASASISTPLVVSQTNLADVVDGTVCVTSSAVSATTAPTAVSAVASSATGCGGGNMGAIIKGRNLEIIAPVSRTSTFVQQKGVAASASLGSCTTASGTASAAIATSATVTISSGATVSSYQVAAVRDEQRSPTLLAASSASKGAVHTPQQLQREVSILKSQRAADGSLPMRVSSTRNGRVGADNGLTSTVFSSTAKSKVLVESATSSTCRSGSGSATPFKASTIVADARPADTCTSLVVRNIAISSEQSARQHQQPRTEEHQQQKLALQSHMHERQPKQEPLQLEQDMGKSDKNSMHQNHSCRSHDSTREVHQAREQSYKQEHTYKIELALSPQYEKGCAQRHQPQSTSQKDLCQSNSPNNFSSEVLPGGLSGGYGNGRLVRRSVSVSVLPVAPAVPHDKVNKVAPCSTVFTGCLPGDAAARQEAHRISVLTLDRASGASTAKTVVVGSPQRGAASVSVLPPALPSTPLSAATEPSAVGCQESAGQGDDEITRDFDDRRSAGGSGSNQSVISSVPSGSTTIGAATTIESERRQLQRLHVAVTLAQTPLIQPVEIAAAATGRSSGVVVAAGHSATAAGNRESSNDSRELAAASTAESSRSLACTSISARTNDSIGLASSESLLRRSREICHEMRWPSPTEHHASIDSEAMPALTASGAKGEGKLNILGENSSEVVPVNDLTEALDTGAEKAYCGPKQIKTPLISSPSSSLARIVVSQRKHISKAADKTSRRPFTSACVVAVGPLSPVPPLTQSSAADISTDSAVEATVVDAGAESHQQRASSASLTSRRSRRRRRSISSPSASPPISRSRVTGKGAEEQKAGRPTLGCSLTATDGPVSVKRRELAVLEPSQIKEYRCPACEWRGVDGWALRRHLNTHLRPFRCSLCDYRAARPERLAAHALRVHGRHLCARCDRPAFAADAAALDRHVRTAHRSTNQYTRPLRLEPATSAPAIATIAGPAVVPIRGTASAAMLMQRCQLIEVGATVEQKTSTCLVPNTAQASTAVATFTDADGSRLRASPPPSPLPPVESLPGKKSGDGVVVYSADCDDRYDRSKTTAIKALAGMVATGRAIDAAAISSPGDGELDAVDREAAESSVVWRRVATSGEQVSSRVAAVRQAAACTDGGGSGGSSSSSKTTVDGGSPTSVVLTVAPHQARVPDTVSCTESAADTLISLSVPDQTTLPTSGSTIAETVTTVKGTVAETASEAPTCAAHVAVEGVKARGTCSKSNEDDDARHDGSNRGNDCGGVDSVEAIRPPEQRSIASRSSNDNLLTRGCNETRRRPQRFSGEGDVDDELQPTVTKRQSSNVAADVTIVATPAADCVGYSNQATVSMTAQIGSSSPMATGGLAKQSTNVTSAVIVSSATAAAVVTDASANVDASTTVISAASELVEASSAVLTSGKSSAELQTLVHPNSHSNLDSDDSIGEQRRFRGDSPEKHQQFCSASPSGGDDLETVRVNARADFELAKGAESDIERITCRITPEADESLEQGRCCGASDAVGGLYRRRNPSQSPPHERQQRRQQRFRQSLLPPQSLASLSMNASPLLHEDDERDANGQSCSNVLRNVDDKAVHEGVDTFCCPSCVLSFADASSLASHLLEAERLRRLKQQSGSKRGDGRNVSSVLLTPARPYECVMCGVRRVTQNEMIEHMLLHSGHLGKQKYNHTSGQTIKKRNTQCRSRSSEITVVNSSPLAKRIKTETVMLPSSCIWTSAKPSASKSKSYIENPSDESPREDPGYDMASCSRNVLDCATHKNGENYNCDQLQCVYCGSTDIERPNVNNTKELRRFVSDSCTCCRKCASDRKGNHIKAGLYHKSRRKDRSTLSSINGDTRFRTCLKSSSTALASLSSKSEAKNSDNFHNACFFHSPYPKNGVVLKHFAGRIECSRSIDVKGTGKDSSAVSRMGLNAPVASTISNLVSASAVTESSLLCNSGLLDRLDGDHSRKSSTDRIKPVQLAAANSERADCSVDGNTDREVALGAFFGSKKDPRKFVWHLLADVYRQLTERESLDSLTADILLSTIRKLRKQGAVSSDSLNANTEVEQMSAARFGKKNVNVAERKNCQKKLNVSHADVLGIVQSTKQRQTAVGNKMAAVEQQVDRFKMTTQHGKSAFFGRDHKTVQQLTTTNISASHNKTGGNTLTSRLSLKSAFDRKIFYCARCTNRIRLRSFAAKKIHVLLKHQVCCSAKRRRFWTMAVSRYTAATNVDTELSDACLQRGRLFVKDSSRCDRRCRTVAFYKNSSHERCSLAGSPEPAASTILRTQSSDLCALPSVSHFLSFNRDNENRQLNAHQVHCQHQQQQDQRRQQQQEQILLSPAEEDNEILSSLTNDLRSQRRRGRPRGSKNRVSEPVVQRAGGRATIIDAANNKDSGAAVDNDGLSISRTTGNRSAHNLEQTVVLNSTPKNQASVIDIANTVTGSEESACAPPAQRGPSLRRRKRGN